MVDSKIDQCLNYLNMVMAKLLARNAALGGLKEPREGQVAEMERLEMALNYVRATVQLLEDSPERDDELQYTLPF